MLRAKNDLSEIRSLGTTYSEPSGQLAAEV